MRAAKSDDTSAARRQGATTCGEVAEWSIASHSKCEVLARVPGVRIPPSPPVNVLKYNKIFVFDVDFLELFQEGVRIPVVPPLTSSMPRNAADGYSNLYSATRHLTSFSVPYHATVSPSLELQARAGADFVALVIVAADALVDPLAKARHKHFKVVADIVGHRKR